MDLVMLKPIDMNKIHDIYRSMFNYKDSCVELTQDSKDTGVNSNEILNECKLNNVCRELIIVSNDEELLNY